MVVLSSDPLKKILAEEKDYGLENIFDEIIADVYDKAEKIEELIKKNNFKKKETVFIGDSNHEVEVGKQAGIKTLAVTWGFCSENRLKSTNPDYLVHNIKELEEILL
jgi:phosphoglycolate phosphatase